MGNGVCAPNPVEVDTRHVFEHARTLLRLMGASFARDQLTRRDIASLSLAQVTLTIFFLRFERKADLEERI